MSVYRYLFALILTKKITVCDRSKCDIRNKFDFYHNWSFALYIFVGSRDQIHILLPPPSLNSMNKINQNEKNVRAFRKLAFVVQWK